MLMQMNLGMILSVSVSMFLSIVALVYRTDIFRKHHILSLIQKIMASYIKTLMPLMVSL